MSSNSWEPAETAVTRFTRGHFSELIKKDAGGEGVLYAAKHGIHGNVMVKVFKSPDKYSEQEVKILVRMICHQNIVRLLGSFYFEDGTDDMRSGYVMEFMANGSLYAVIHDLSIQYDYNQMYSWIQQAGRGIAYLHSQDIIHCDFVREANLLIPISPPNRPLSLEIQNSFDTDLTLLIGGYRDNMRVHETILAFKHNTKTWKELDVEIPNYDSGAVVLDEELYAFGGDKIDTGLFKLNLKYRSWIKLSYIPNGRSSMFFQSVAYRSFSHLCASLCTAFAYVPDMKTRKTQY